MQLVTCGPVVAWLTTNPAANTVHLCQNCLDWWFDEADYGASNEPLAWGWTGQREPAALTDEQIARALTDPRNRTQVSQVLRFESFRDPAWLREFLRREELRARHGWFARSR
jgi:hypothetical protein